MDEKNEPCQHDWEEITRVRNRYEPTMVSGYQQCRKCGEKTYYSKEADEE